MIDIIESKDLINIVVEILFADVLRFIFTMSAIVFIFFLMMAWILGIDDRMWNILMKILLAIFTFGILVLLDKGALPLPF